MNKDWERAAWLGAVCVIIGYYLNAHQHASSWLFWIVGNILIGFYCLNKNKERIDTNFEATDY